MVPLTLTLNLVAMTQDTKRIVINTWKRKHKGVRILQQVVYHTKDATGKLKSITKHETPR